MSLPYYYHKTNMFPDIIILVSSTLFQIYDITSCDYSYVLLHHPKEKRKKIKRKEILNQEK